MRWSFALLPVEHPRELVLLSGPKMQNQSFPDYLAFRDRTKTLSGGLVMHRTPVVLAAGTLLGGAAALVTGNFATAILYGVSPKDPSTYATAILLMAAVALIACLLPAQRALAVDPAERPKRRIAMRFSCCSARQ
jgi:hypothetical protein